jgi:hypothetical protein
MAEMARFARNSEGVLLCFAGTPVAKSAPNGMKEILSLGNASSPRATAGLTPIKSAAAFTAPAFQTTTSYLRSGHKVEHYATVLRTISKDATHDSFYPASGLHQKPLTSGQRTPEYWEITDRLSELIRQGEQEHLNDALRAYELTYKHIENEINKLAGIRFGPAASPGAATQLALDELGRRLPKQLGTNPADWVKALDRLLQMTLARDKNLLHSLETDSIRQDQGKTIELLKPSTFFRVGQVPSSQIVTL